MKQQLPQQDDIAISLSAQNQLYYSKRISLFLSQLHLLNKYLHHTMMEMYKGIEPKLGLLNLFDQLHFKCILLHMYYCEYIPPKIVQKDQYLRIEFHY